MSLGIIAAGPLSYVETSSGRYVLSTLPFGAPRDEFKIVGGSLAKKAKPVVTTAAVSRFWEKERAQGVSTFEPRPRCLLSLNLQVSDGVSADEVSDSIDELRLLLTPALLMQIMNGAS